MTPQTPLSDTVKSTKRKRPVPELLSSTMALPSNKLQCRSHPIVVTSNPTSTVRILNADASSLTSASTKPPANANPQTLTVDNLCSSERENWQLKRTDIAQQLANAYPHLVASSYATKREKQLARLAKKQEMLAAATTIRDPPYQSVDPVVSTSSRTIVLTKTIASFETVDDDDGGMDWNRSRTLANALREDLAKGRKLSLPALKCAQSQSQDPHSNES
ncbi:hypothetical protein B0H34DRAFT_208960 [Crassisporium funariophilum]|nr:hypothetical protein B0H34DRAFT_208960 [Crassisporium funariophilum]